MYKNMFVSKEVLRYLLSGVINAVVTFAVIAGISISTGNPYTANVGGFVAGAISGSILHIRYTFSTRLSGFNLLIYALVLVSGYFLNLAVLAIALPYLKVQIAQVISIGAYICYSYSVQKHLYRKY
jgi:putative flippase GtrA